MKSSRPAKKKKKENTWAEAITEVLVRSTTKKMRLQEIHERIYAYKLKDIGMTKTDEKNLRTMLAQHTNSTAADNCAFYRVKDNPGCYALKDPNMTSRLEPAADASDPDSVNEDSSASGNPLKRKSKRKPSSPNIARGDQKSLDVRKKLITDKLLSSNVAKRSNSYSGKTLRNAQLLAHRRTSTPMISAFANLRNRHHLQQVHRSRSATSLLKSASNSNFSNRKSQLNIDLETPGSVLTNTRLKSLLNSAIFSMLPASYQYQLIQLLPEIDRKIDENGVPRMTPTALSNEFFSQALQDWVTQLSEGEFTRETQARILQEISKERSKISPWKEKFFEEYYGQKKELKRTRSRSHDATSHLTDLSYEAQVVKFRHLSTAIGTADIKVEDVEDRENVITIDSDSESDQDPDYPEKTQATARQLSKDPAKPVNRRKINKPFKRTMFNSTSGNLLFSDFGTGTHFKPDSMLPSHPNFQVRGDMYKSDSETSETGALSDSNNSFHQHDETDDDGESSDEIMNIGDDNLMDVDESESDSDTNERQNSDTVDYTYAKTDAKNRRPSSENREWRTTSQTVKTEGKTLVLRPRGNLIPSTQTTSEACSKPDEDQTVVKSEEKDEKPAISESSTVVQATTSFVQAVQPVINVCYGESIIPRISATSGLLSSPITPTTVCTSTTSARLPESSKNDNSRMLPIRQTVSEITMPLKMGRNQQTPPSGKLNLETHSPPIIKSEMKHSPHSPVICPKSISFSAPSVIMSKPVFGSTQNLWPQQSTVTKSTPQTAGPALPMSKWSSEKNVTQPDNKKTSPAGTSQPSKSTRPPTATSSPVKKTRTLAEIKAQMKAKRLAASGSPAKSPKPGFLSSVSKPPPVKIAQPVFCPNPVKTEQAAPIKTSEAHSVPTPPPPPPIVKTESGRTSPVLVSMFRQGKGKSEISESAKSKPLDSESGEKESKVTGKIILKIKAAEGKKYSVKLDNPPRVSPLKTSESEDDEIVRKTRRLSQVILSSGDSTDDSDAVRDAKMGGKKLKENYTLLTQLMIPGGCGSVMDSLLKRTQRSPVFGEPAFEGLSMSKNVQILPNTSTENSTQDTKNQPFMSDKPAIGFQDIPSCTALSSNTSTFAQSSSIVSVAGETQKYRSTSKGKSLIQMQQLARCNQIHSDESDPPDSDTEDDSTASTTSSADDDRLNKNQNNDRALRSRTSAKKRETGDKSEKVTHNGPRVKKSDDSDCEDSFSSSSNDEKLITKCICSCKRLVSCKGCGAYTHEECLSATKLCSLCV